MHQHFPEGGLEEVTGENVLGGLRTIPCIDLFYLFWVHWTALYNTAGMF